MFRVFDRIISVLSSFAESIEVLSTTAEQGARPNEKEREPSH